MAGRAAEIGRTWRIAIRRIHLWLGLSLGLLFALIGLTGSALVFYVGIDQALHPEARSETAAPGPGWASPVWDRALATGRAAGFDPAGKWSFEVTGEGGAIPARFYPPAAEGVQHPPRQMVWFSLDGLRIVRVAPWGGYLMSWLYQLHMELLAGDIGMQIVGWSGVVTLVLLLTGIIAWWPRGSWRKALSFKRRAAPIRRLHDLHKLSGVTSSIFLVILVATGVILALPSVKAALLSPAPVPDPRSPESTGPVLPISSALKAARQVFPEGQLAFIDVPGDATMPYRIRVQVPADPHRRFPGSYAFVDQRSGRVIDTQTIGSGGLGTAINAWVRPLHDGSVGGLPVRILAVLIGLAPTVLLVTGLLHWWRRERSPAPFRGRAVAARPTPSTLPSKENM